MIKVESTTGAEIVSTADVKEYANISTSDNDTMIGELIIGARRLCETKANLALVEKTVSQVYPSFGEFFKTYRLLAGPVKSITSITYYDTDNASQTVSSSDYSLDLVSIPARVNFVENYSTPDTYTRTDAVKVTYVVGLTRDEDIKLAEIAIKAVVAYMYDNPTDSVKKLPTQSEYLLMALREKFL